MSPEIDCMEAVVYAKQDKDTIFFARLANKKTIQS
jgi:hypothetical protein